MPSPDWLTQTPFAHRGLHEAAAGVPENSLAACAAAIEAGYGVELDARLTADGVPVLFHDATLARLTGSEERVASVSATTLGKIRLSGSDEAIPRLADALGLVRGRVPLLLELKTSWFRTEPLEAAVWKLLRDYRGPCAVLSFNPLSLNWFQRHAPAVPRGQNVGRTAGGPRVRGALASVRIWHRIAEPQILCCQLGSLDRRAAVHARAQGLTVIAWTVRNEAERRKVAPYADNFMFEGFRP